MHVSLLAILSCLSMAAQPARTLPDLVMGAGGDYCWVVVDAEDGTWLATFRKLLAEDELVELNLAVRPVRATLQPELFRLLKGQGWKHGTWALLDREGKLLAQGQATEGIQAILVAVGSAGIQAPTRRLEAFLLQHPDHTQAFQALIVAHLNAATARMEKHLGPLDAAGSERSLPKALTPGEDARIWGASARLLRRLYREGLDEMGAMPISYALPHIARHSALMGQVAKEVLPVLEARLLQVPGDFVAWEAWVRLNGMAQEKRSIRSLIEQMPPLPGRPPSLPGTVVSAFGEEARAQRNWQAIVDVLGPVWEFFLEVPARKAPEGSEAAKQWLDYEWTQASALLEARIRLDQDQEAVALATQLVNHTGQKGAARRAGALAASCGKPVLAKRMASLAPAKDDSKPR